MAETHLDNASGAGMTGAGIVGVGSYTPRKILTNADLEKMVDTSDEWIVQRTGVRERRIIEEGETTTGMAVEAARRALQNAGADGSRVGMVIVATSTPDYLTPPAAAVVQHAIGATACAAFDIGAGCAGSLYGMVLAEQAIRCGFCEYAMVIGSETLSRVVDWEDRKTCVVFGDGAGAVLLGRTPAGTGFISTALLSDGGGSDLITIPGLSITDDDISRRGGTKKTTVWMDGSKVMKFAIRAMASIVKTVVEKAGISVDDLKLVIPHQANKRIIDGAASRLGLDESRVFVNIDKYGNTSAASLPIAIEEAMSRGLIKSGDYAVLTAFGAGLLHGAALLKFQ